jgi:hypothetical protein
MSPVRVFRLYEATANRIAAQLGIAKFFSEAALVVFIE